MAATTTSTIMAPGHALSSDSWLAAAGFLTRYSGATRVACTADLKSYFSFCAGNNLDPLEATRVQVELLGPHHGGCRTGPGHGPGLSSVAGFYRFAAIDGRIEHSPAEFVRRFKVDWESTTLGLDRMELSAFIAQGAPAGPVDHALARLLGLLGLRVSEACGIDIEDLSTERGHRTVTVLGKGAKLAILPMPPHQVSACIPAALGRSRWPSLEEQVDNRARRVVGIENHH